MWRKISLFFDEKGDISIFVLQQKLMEWCEIASWENLKPRLLTACCSDLAWKLLENLKKIHEEEKREIEQAKKKSKLGKKKDVAMPYGSLYQIFSNAIPENVRISCLTALIQKEIGMKDITGFCRGFQGKALIGNTITDHVR
jgi:hypothetical protein